MQRLLYTLERITTRHINRAAVEDAVVGITMAALGVHGIQKEVGGEADTPRIRVTFPDENAMRTFNLRIERALAVRDVKIKKIQIEVPPTSGAVRAEA